MVNNGHMVSVLHTYQCGDPESHCLITRSSDQGMTNSFRQVLSDIKIVEKWILILGWGWYFDSGIREKWIGILTVKFDFVRNWMVYCMSILYKYMLSGLGWMPNLGGPCGQSTGKCKLDHEYVLL